jgi:hypothetical protein
MNPEAQQDESFRASEDLTSSAAARNSSDHIDHFVMPEENVAAISSLDLDEQGEERAYFSESDQSAIPSDEEMGGEQGQPGQERDWDLQDTDYQPTDDEWDYEQQYTAEHYTQFQRLTAPLVRDQPLETEENQQRFVNSLQRSQISPIWLLAAFFIVVLFTCVIVMLMSSGGAGY